MASNPPDSNTTDLNSAIKENSGRDIYTDPKLAEVPVNDPIYDLIKQNWKQFTATILAVLAGIYVVQSFRESYDSSMQASADIFQRLQISYKEDRKLNENLEALKADPKTEPSKIEELNKKITENKSRFEQLSNSAADSREPYKNFAILYRAAIENSTISKEILKQFADWKNHGKAGSSERLNAELAAMQLARLEMQTPEDFSKGKELAKDLAANGEFVAVSAAKMLASFASSEAEKAEAKGVIEALIKNEPSQADLLRDTLNSL
jgi:hypothetical protein